MQVDLTGLRRLFGAVASAATVRAARHGLHARQTNGPNHHVRGEGVCCEEVCGGATKKPPEERRWRGRGAHSARLRLRLVLHLALHRRRRRCCPPPVAAGSEGKRGRKRKTPSSRQDLPRRRRWLWRRWRRRLQRQLWRRQRLRLWLWRRPRRLRTARKCAVISHGRQRHKQCNGAVLLPRKAAQTQGQRRCLVTPTNTHGQRPLSHPGRRRLPLPYRGRHQLRTQNNKTARG